MKWALICTSILIGVQGCPLLAEGLEIDLSIQTDLKIDADHTTAYVVALKDSAIACLKTHGLTVGKVSDDVATPLPDEGGSPLRMEIQHHGSVTFGTVHGRASEEVEKTTDRSGKIVKQSDTVTVTWLLPIEQKGSVACKLLRREGDKWKCVKEWSVTLPATGKNEYEVGTEQYDASTGKHPYQGKPEDRRSALMRVMPGDFVGEFDLMGDLVSVKITKGVVTGDLTQEQMLVTVDLWNKSPWPIHGFQTIVVVPGFKNDRGGVSVTPWAVQLSADGDVPPGKLTTLRYAGACHGCPQPEVRRAMAEEEVEHSRKALIADMFFKFIPADR